MKNVIILGLVVLFTSCTQKKIMFYEYNGVTVKRIDKGNEIYFYYGNCDDNNGECSKSYVKAEYSGLNSGMNAYIVFNPNGKVDVIRIYDSFEQVGSDSLINLINHNGNIEFLKWKESLLGNYSNIIEVSDVLTLEKKMNSENHTNVKARYPSDN